MRNRTLLACMLGMSLFVGCEEKFPEPPQPPVPMGPDHLFPQTGQSPSETTDTPDPEDSTGAM